MQAHFVTFYSPGTLFPEETTKPIDTWNVEAALLLAAAITERHGAKPYAFAFSTRSRGPNDLDSKVTARSHFYFLGGKILTRADIAARNDPSDEILLKNMEYSDIPRVVENTNSWKVTVPLGPQDVVLQWPRPVEHKPTP